jgi:hypothetical protein
MRQRIELENIEEMRREAGIDDVELHEAIRCLRAGDSVRLTARVGARAFPGVCLLIRITSIRGSLFRGRVDRKSSSTLAEVKAGALLTFTEDHIHSVVSKRGGDS